MEYRIEKDTMGEVKVPENALYGAQTARSVQNFKIGVEKERMPEEIIKGFGLLKLAAAKANHELNEEKMTHEKLSVITQACNMIIEDELSEHFPLVVWQTGSGTQTNMNVNEVIANYSNALLGAKILHPNDDVNMSQSSNDTFPSAMHIAAYISITEQLLPELKSLISTLLELENENANVIKCGRTHLQDATPISFAQEISGWRGSLQRDYKIIFSSSEELLNLAIGGTAVGTGINAPPKFGEKVAEKLCEITGYNFVSDENKFHALSSRDELVFVHGAIKALAADLMKIANDIRWLASGPRNGLCEIYIPENEPGSSIMPGKVNPTQCEAVTMVATQVMGNDAAIGFAASQGNFELNVFLPVIAYNFLQSVRLLSDAIRSFNSNCIKGIKPNTEKMRKNLESSLMLITALNPYIGYENAAKCAKFAYQEGLTLKEACIKLKLLDEKKIDEILRPEKMI